MTTIEELQQMQSYLEINCSNSPEEIEERISTLNVYMARSGQMLADAKKLLRSKRTEQISQTIIKIAKESCLSATVQNALLDSICENESYLVDWTERVNRSCTHQLDSLRSLLSFEKEELRMTKSEC